MARAELLLLMATTLSCLGSAWTTCKGSTKIECMTKGQCIRLEHVCNGGRDCTDNSDEDPELCKMWIFKTGNCTRPRVSCNGQCYNFPRFCSKAECSSSVHPRVCQMVREKKFNIPKEESVFAKFQKDETVSDLIQEEMPPPAPLQIMSLKIGEEDFSEEVQNSTEVEDDVLPSCPSLYTLVGTRCLALFTLAKVPWPEAREFCKSIHGDLVDFDVVSFLDLTQHLREAGITADFWIGGRYNATLSSWSWVSDDSPMPQGTPFWAVRQGNSCEIREPQKAIRVLNRQSGLNCHYHYQAPEREHQGWCSAINYDQYHYITDEMCHTERSPLCVLTEMPRNSSYLETVKRI